jgi:hypothetical protein
MNFEGSLTAGVIADHPGNRIGRFSVMRYSIKFFEDDRWIFLHARGLPDCSDS